MKKKTILVVEDNESLNKLIKLKLERDGYRVLVCENGEDGLKMFEKENFDLVWLDIYLPGMSGLEVLEKIRKNPKTKNQKVFMVTVSGSNKK